jgi:hypothetical protein
VLPRIVDNQKLSFDLNRCVLQVQLQIEMLLRWHNIPCHSRCNQRHGASRDP